MRLLYSIGIYLYGAGILIASLFDRKASLWVKGRRAQHDRLDDFSKKNTGKKVAWFHCASLGEFEQGRPVIEGFKQRNPDWKVVLTFFSPSGFEIRKDYPGADAVFYLPLDTPASAGMFIGKIKPRLAVFVKYEFWFNYLNILYKKDVPIYVISAIFRDGQHFFSKLGSWQRRQLRKVSRFFVQDEHSKDLLHGIGIMRVTVSGDTRFDRVMKVASSSPEVGKIQDHIDQKKVFVGGSTWPEDEDKILPLAKDLPDLYFIIAPHETDREHISALENKFADLHPVKFTDGKETQQRSRLLIIDTIGILSQLYRYADIAYIGGGFGAGIHNILEAAAYGKAVIFGPNYRKFNEARELIDQGGAFSVGSSEELVEMTRKLLDDPVALAGAAEASSNYVRSRTGATEAILERIEKELGLGV